LKESIQRTRVGILRSFCGFGHSVDGEENACTDFEAGTVRVDRRVEGRGIDMRGLSEFIDALPLRSYVSLCFILEMLLR
jgi:hypothetical protein